MYSSRDPNEIAGKIIYMIENEKETLEMGSKGRRAIYSEYNCSTNSRTIESILKEQLS